MSYNPVSIDEYQRLLAENERLRALMEKELKVYQYGVSERVRLEKELEQAEARVAALEAALDRITRFVDYTVREWIEYADDHQNCDSSCAHRGAVDRQYETVEEIVTEACAALARPTPAPQEEQG